MDTDPERLARSSVQIISGEERLCEGCRTDLLTEGTEKEEDTEIRRAGLVRREA